MIVWTQPSIVMVSYNRTLLKKLFIQQHFASVIQPNSRSKHERDALKLVSIFWDY